MLLPQYAERGRQAMRRRRARRAKWRERARDGQVEGYVAYSAEVIRHVAPGVMKITAGELRRVDTRRYPAARLSDTRVASKTRQSECISRAVRHDARR